MSNYACPKCDSNSSVVDSRVREAGTTYRRRRCLNNKCRNRWTTVEMNVDEYKSMREYWLSAHHTFTQIAKAIKLAKVSRLGKSAVRGAA
jgi:transcriptional regulator NrdR family protein